MFYEIMEAIKEYYKSDEETIVECFLWLADKLPPMDGADFAEEIREMGYCSDCGEEMAVRTYEEIHTELDGNPIEVCYERYCPNCGRTD